MEAAYKLYNQAAAAAGRDKGIFMIDMARPGHMTACLKTFQQTIGANEDHWDAAFQVGREGGGLHAASTA
jgi:hypothetical protein